LVINGDGVSDGCNSPRQWAPRRQSLSTDMPR